MAFNIIDESLPLKRDRSSMGAFDGRASGDGVDGRNLSDPSGGKGFIMHNVREFIQEMSRGLFTWSQKSSIWPLTFGIKCCAIEMMAFGAARYDSDRMGVFFRASPRQADLMIVAGPATVKLKDVILRLYEQMPEPKYVIAFGECAICGGPFWDSYSVIAGVDKLIPVDVYVPGCPPRPEQLLLAIKKLQEIIDERSLAQRHGRTVPRVTHIITPPHHSREELLAEVLAHPTTLSIGHQSGLPRYQPTPSELARATPTGQPAQILAMLDTPRVVPVAPSTTATPASVTPSVAAAPATATPPAAVTPSALVTAISPATVTAALSAPPIASAAVPTSLVPTSPVPAKTSIPAPTAMPTSVPSLAPQPPVSSSTVRTPTPPPPTATPRSLAQIAEAMGIPYNDTMPQEKTAPILAVATKKEVTK